MAAAMTVAEALLDLRRAMASLAVVAEKQRGLIKRALGDLT